MAEAELGTDSDSPRFATATIRIRNGEWLDIRSRKIRRDPIVALAGTAALLLGESHDDPAHHRWQRDTLGALLGARSDLVLGFEMFPRRVQPVLDRWIRAELDEAAFLAEVDWPRIWGFDPELYLPLFRFARAYHLPIVALNIDRDTHRRVATGGFAAVPMTDREGVGDPWPPAAAYRDRLSAWFKQHPGAAADGARFERFVRAQTFWDRAMAEAIAAAVQRHPRSLVVGIMGSGHVEYADGVPHQLAALGVGDVITALPWAADTDCPITDPPIADFAFGIRSES